MHDGHGSLYRVVGKVSSYSLMRAILEVICKINGYQIIEAEVVFFWNFNAFLQAGYYESDMLLNNTVDDELLSKIDLMNKVYNLVHLASKPSAKLYIGCSKNLNTYHNIVYFGLKKAHIQLVMSNSLREKWSKPQKKNHIKFPANSWFMI